jgi:cysteine desulfurase
MSNGYFNNAFSKQPLREAVESMQPFLREEFENPLTESEGGERARATITQAKTRIAELIGASPEEIYFVSSGTEANNWAVKGAAWHKEKKHLVISAIEHFSIYQPALFLRRHGFDVSIVPVDSDGLVDPDQVAAAIRASTVLVAIQCASDEIGVVQNYAAVAALKERYPEVLFHTDAVQFLCYESLDVRSARFDLISLSSNALYGPSGIAALYIRKGTRLQPLLHGGMQEEGMRPGLQSMALVAGFGKAAEVNLREKKLWKEHLSRLQRKLFTIPDRFGIRLTGSRANRLVDNLHLLADVDGEAILALLEERGIHASSGSTCYTYAQKESHVLEALGISSEYARGALLFTLSIDHTDDDVEGLDQSFADVLSHLRSLKP